MKHIVPARCCHNTIACLIVAVALIGCMAVAGGFGIRPGRGVSPRPEPDREEAEERARQEAEISRKGFGILPRTTQPVTSSPAVDPEPPPEITPAPEREEAEERSRQAAQNSREGFGIPARPKKPLTLPRPAPPRHLPRRPAPPRAGADIPFMTASPGELWEIDRGRAAVQTGTGGLDPFTVLPAEILGKGITTNDTLPDGTSVRNGFYFTGPGRVLPECALRVGRPDQIQRIEAGRMRPRAYTDQYWAGPEDCSALAWMIRDDRDMVVQIDVSDDVFVSLPMEDALTVSDAVELFLDVRGGDRGSAKYVKGVMHILLVPTRGGNVHVRYGALEQAISGLQARWRQTEGGYRMLVRIPVQNMGWKHGYPASAFSFDWAVRDSDSMGALDTLMTWSGTHANADDARRFGKLRAIRRGVYLTSAPADGRVPSFAVMRAETRFHVRGGGPGGGSWGAPEDCSAAAWVVRNEDGFAVTIDVTDDIVETSALNPWERDGVELFFDMRPNHSRGKAGYGPGVFQLICAVLSEGGAIEPQFGGDPMVTSVSGVTAKCRLRRNGYTIEVFVPAAGLRENHMIPGERFNFDFVVNDADSPRGRDTLLCWSGDGENWRNAAAFGRFEPARIVMPVR